MIASGREVELPECETQLILVKTNRARCFRLATFSKKTHKLIATHTEVTSISPCIQYRLCSDTYNYPKFNAF
jgi:hypothetical protein